MHILVCLSGIQTKREKNAVNRMKDIWYNTIPGASPLSILDWSRKVTLSSIFSLMLEVFNGSWLSIALTQDCFSSKFSPNTVKDFSEVIIWNANLKSIFFLQKKKLYHPKKKELKIFTICIRHWFDSEFIILEVKESTKFVGNRNCCQHCCINKNIVEQKKVSFFGRFSTNFHKLSTFNQFSIGNSNLNLLKKKNSIWWKTKFIWFLSLHCLIQQKTFQV